MMTSLLPIGGAALGVAAFQALRGSADNFLSHLWPGKENAAATEDGGKAPDPASSIDLNEAISTLAEKIRLRMKAAGSDLREPLRLKSDAWGHVVVDGDHPDRMILEDMFATDAELSGEFQAIQEAAYEHQSRYAAPHLPASGEFRLWLGPREATYVFE